VLGHADGSVTAIYNRYGYVKEMRAVLEQVANDVTRHDPIKLVSRVDAAPAANQPSMLWVPSRVA
jgi:hypothetical protein